LRVRRIVVEDLVADVQAVRTQEKPAGSPASIPAAKRLLRNERHRAAVVGPTLELASV
jgi:hypothetical protein